MVFCFPEINDQTAVVAGSVGGTLALVILISIIVFLVHRRYTCTYTISKISCVVSHDIVRYKIIQIEYMFELEGEMFMCTIFFFTIGFEIRNR